MAVKGVEASTAVTSSNYGFEEREVYCLFKGALFLATVAERLMNLPDYGPSDVDMIHSGTLIAGPKIEMDLALTPGILLIAHYTLSA